MSSMNVRINSKGFTHRSTEPDDADKSIEVPAGESWDIETIFVTLATTATAGDRQIFVEILDTDGSTVLFAAPAGAVQAPSTTQSYSFAHGLENQTSFNLILSTAFPKLRLGPGEFVRVYDQAFVDTAADDMVFHMMVQTTRS